MDKVLTFNTLVSCRVSKGTAGLLLVVFYKYSVPKGTGVFAIIISWENYPCNSLLNHYLLLPGLFIFVLWIEKSLFQRQTQWNFQQNYYQFFCRLPLCTRNFGPGRSFCLGSSNWMILSQPTYLPHSFLNWTNSFVKKNQVPDKGQFSIQFPFLKRSFAGFQLFLDPYLVEFVMYLYCICKVTITHVTDTLQIQYRNITERPNQVLSI